MKKNLSIIFSLLLAVLLLAGCTGNGNTAGSQSGGTTPDATTPGGTASDGTASAMTASDLLQKVLEGAASQANDGNPLPETLNDPVTAANAPGMLGVTPDDFTSFATDASVATSSDSAVPFHVAVAICKDADSAATLADLIQNGFDSSKWVTVFPEQSLTVKSGIFVLLASGTAGQTMMLADSFKAAAGGNSGNSGSAGSEVNAGGDGNIVVFYTGETGGTTGETGGDTESANGTANSEGAVGSEG